jgi:hypothetical protein
MERPSGRPLRPLGQRVPVYGFRVGTGSLIVASGVGLDAYSAQPRRAEEQPCPRPAQPKLPSTAEQPPALSSQLGGGSS